MKYYFYLVLIVCLFCGCTKNLPFPEADNLDVLVLNGMLSPGNIPSIHLSQSCQIADVNCNQKSIENGQVFLKDESGNNLVELIHKSNGIYSAEGYQIEYQKVYEIEASSPGLATISSKTETPKSFSWELISLDEEEYLDYTCRTFQIEIKDNPDEENYYLIDGIVDILNGSHGEGESEVNGYIEPHTGFLSNDINSENTALSSTVDIVALPLQYVFLTDANFNGETYPLKFGLHEFDLFGVDLELEATINVQSVTKEVYEYYRSIVQYKLTGGNPLSEPVQILSNIENGIGFFGGISEQKKLIELPASKFGFLEIDVSIENDGCSAPCTVKFFAQLSEDLDVFWDFGDGTNSTELNPEHSYQNVGDYFVVLTVSFGADIITSSFIVNIN